jgi:hypothetical protein
VPSTRTGAPSVSCCSLDHHYDMVYQRHPPPPSSPIDAARAGPSITSKMTPPAVAALEAPLGPSPQPHVPSTTLTIGQPMTWLQASAI